MLRDRMVLENHDLSRAPDAPCRGSTISSAVSSSLRGDLLTRFARDQSGAYAPMLALLLPIMVGTAGLGGEVGLWMYRHQQLQGVADMGAVSAATAGGSSSVLNAEASAAAASYGLINGRNGVTVTVNSPPTSGTHLSTAGAVEVIAQLSQPRLLSAVFNKEPVLIMARAVAVGTGGAGCILALNGSASGAIGTQGTSQIVLNGCSLYANSTSGSAVNVGGSSKISALTVGVTGGVSGASSITATNGIKTGIPPTTDPYASVSVPSSFGCDQNNLTVKAPMTINAGVYCNGITINAGASLTLNPGIYYIDQGSLSVAGNGSINGTGVTLVFTSSSGTNWASASISSNAIINLTAPTSGALAGIVMFGDRRMTVDTPFKLNGGGSQTFGGAVYLPKASLNFTGGSSTVTGCTQVIADMITFSGNSNVLANCTGFGTKAVGSATAALSE
jgi:hypothetical protein